MKLALGTVQFGLDYGVSNTTGKLGLKEVRQILNLALERGIDLFDTAPSYGDSEQVLGHCLPPRVGRIVTKTPHLSSDVITQADVDEVRRTFERTLTALRRDHVYSLMIHNPRDLAKPGIDRLLELLLQLRSEERIEKIGASLYLPAQLDHVLDRLPIDLVQAPLNLLDQRLVKGGQLARCADHGVEFHARSIFLQGFLLSDFDQLPSWLESYRGVHESFLLFCNQYGLTSLQTALAYVLAREHVQHIVCGVANLEQFEAILEAMRVLESCDIAGMDFSSVACDDELLISPNRWKELRAHA